MRRNVAGQFVTAKLINKADGTPCTTGTTTVYVTGDAGTQAAGSVGAGAATHEGNGVWSYAPAQAETNYTQVDFVFVNTNAVNAGPSIYPTAYDANGRYDVGAVGGTTQTAGDIIGDTNDIQARLPAALVGGRIDANMGAISADSVAADNAESFFDGTGYAGTNNVIPSVTLVGTLTTYTGNTPQTGDSFARIGALGAGLTAVGDTAGTTTLLSRLSALRAGYLDNLSAGAVALASGVNMTQWLGGTPNALIAGRLDVNMQAGATGVVSASLLAADAANEIADALLDRADAIETGETPRMAWRHALAALAGVLSGAATTTVVIKGAGVATTRITATVDADGNRSAVVLT